MKKKIKERREELQTEKHKSKNMQSEHYKGFDLESHKWLECNIDVRKVSAIINMQEQMIETRGWKANRGLNQARRKRGGGWGGFSPPNNLLKFVDFVSQKGCKSRGRKN